MSLASYAICFAHTYIYLATAGQVVDVFMAILTGCFSLVMLGSQMQGKASQLSILGPKIGDD